MEMKTPAQTLRYFAEWLEAQARGYDRMIRRPSRERSTMAEAYRQAASQARQHAARYERIQDQTTGNGKGVQVDHA